MKTPKSKKVTSKSQVKRSARRDRQLSFEKVNGWGGKRKGAGRTNLSGTVNHMARPKISLKTPLHLTLRLIEGLPTLRRAGLLDQFKRSAAKAKAFGLFVNHFSIQGNHIHILAEAKSNEDLARGMRSLTIGLAKTIRKNAHAQNGAKRSGSVFAGRYHVHVLRTPTETKNALEYVLLNTSKHKTFIEHMDSYSSASHFTQWKKLLGRRYDDVIRWEAEACAEDGPDTTLLAALSPPKSWLAREGWMRA